MVLHLVMLVDYLDLCKQGIYVSALLHITMNTYDL